MPAEELSKQYHRAIDNGHILLATANGPEKMLITSPLVRSHIEDVLDQLRVVRNHFQFNPRPWRWLIVNADRDMGVMKWFVMAAGVEGAEERQQAYRERLEQADLEIGNRRKDAPPQVRERLDELSIDMKDAYQKGCDSGDYADLLQPLLESWVHLFEIYRPYEGGAVMANSALSCFRLLC